MYVYVCVHDCVRMAAMTPAVGSIIGLFLAMIDWYSWAHGKPVIGFIKRAAQLQWKLATGGIVGNDTMLIRCMVITDATKVVNSRPARRKCVQGSDQSKDNM